MEDDKIRSHLKHVLPKSSISKIVIERTLKINYCTINTARPGIIIIGKGGKEVDKLKEELKSLTKKKKFRSIFLKLSVELDARTVADSIARQIEGRISFRRAAKMSIAAPCVLAPKASRLKYQAV